MWKRFFRAIRYAALLFKIGGPKAFLCQIKRQIYSSDILLGLEKSLDADCIQIPSRVEYFLRPASEADMEEVLVRAESESKESARELLQRKWFYEVGFRNCYVARIADTNDLCHLQWLVSSEYDDKAIQGLRNRLAWPNKDEVLIENMYTFEKYRGNNIMPSVTAQLCERVRGKGYKRIITYVRQDNAASLRGMEKVGFKRFEEIPELKLFFYTRRKHSPA